MRRAAKSFWKRLVRYFLAGVLAVLPLVITLAIIGWVAQFLHNVIGPGTLLGTQLESAGGQLVGNRVFAYFLGCVMVLVVIFVLGVAVESGAKRLWQKLIDGIIQRIPLIGNIYGTSRKLVNVLDKSGESELKGMTPVFCIFGKEAGAGFLALMPTPESFHINDIEYQAVVIPSAPIPFGGSLIFVPKSSVQPADMTVDGLVSVYMSMGVTGPQYIKDAAAPP